MGLLRKLKLSIIEKYNTLSQHANLIEARNIKLELQKRALAETCDYIDKNMSNVQSVTTKEEVLIQSIKNVKLDGLYLEFGVWMGETINIISTVTDEEIFGFDSFEGLPEDWRDAFPKGKFDLEGNLPIVQSNVKLIKGWFDDTIPSFIAEHPESLIAFLHVDCDLYSSTVTIFEQLGSKIASGTVIVFDEYFNYPGWRDGEFKAFQEFIKSRGLDYEYLTYNSTNEQVALIVK